MNMSNAAALTSEENVRLNRDTYRNCLPRGRRPQGRGAL